MFVARVAYDTLKEENEAVLKKSEAILAHLLPFTNMESPEHSFVECATFADHVKYDGRFNA